MEHTPQSSFTRQAVHSPQPTRLNIRCSRLKAILCARQSLHNVLRLSLLIPSHDRWIPQFSQHKGAGAGAGTGAGAGAGAGADAVTGNKAVAGVAVFPSRGVSFLTSLLCGPTCCFLALAGLEVFFFFLLGTAKGWVLGTGWHKMPCLKSNRVRSHAGPRYRVSSILLRIFSPVGLGLCNCSHCILLRLYYYC